MQTRLDKFLSDAKVGTRKEIKQFIARKMISIDGVVAKDPSEKRDFSDCTVTFNGEVVEMKHTVLCVLNKPAGYVTSVDDPFSPTVMELVPDKYKKLDVLPVGRLDKDTEGVLLFTNDGDLLHKLISPKSDIPKTYYCRFEGDCPEDADKRLEEGIVLKDGTKCKSAGFELISDNECRITITEGMYHQVKRMAGALGLHITYLKRESFAQITCEGMKAGEFQESENLLNTKNR